MERCWAATDVHWEVLGIGRGAERARPKPEGAESPIKSSCQARFSLQHGITQVPVYFDMEPS